jgi:hypothetical protein
MCPEKKCGRKMQKENATGNVKISHRTESPKYQKRGTLADKLILPENVIKKTP